VEVDPRVDLLDVAEGLVDGAARVRLREVEKGRLVGGADVEPEPEEGPVTDDLNAREVRVNPARVPDVEGTEGVLPRERIVEVVLPVEVRRSVDVPGRGRSLLLAFLLFFVAALRFALAGL